MLLNGSKFSTSRGHVIWAHSYLEAGLPVDPLRGYLASISAQAAESDFRTDRFADWIARVLAGRWDPAVRQALRDGAEDGVKDCAKEPGEALRQEAAALTAADALCPPTTSSREAVVVLDGWIARGERGLAPGEHGTWLAVLAALTWPLMPGLGEQLRAALGGTGHPALTTPLPTRVVAPAAYQGLPAVPRAAVEALLPTTGA